MVRSVKKLNKRIGAFLRKRTPAQIIVVIFALIVLIGTALLSLPEASRSGQSHGFLTALFTSTSATCVTGLVLGDTWSLWSGFGQAVILILIQIGGLGFMSMISVFLLMLRRQFGIKNRMLLSQSFGVDSLESVTRLLRHALLGTLILELAGAIVLALRFSADFGWSRGIRLGVWHSVSAFCNAGFDVFGFYRPDSSLITYQSDPVVLVTVMLLIVLGGLGFFVWSDLLQWRKARRLTVYSRLVLIITGILIVGGAVCVAAFEWNNPATLGDMPVGQKLLGSVFQSVTARTAGFDALGQSGLRDPTKGVTSFLMLIGGSSGSTAGGLKTVTFGVIVLCAIATARGSGRVNVLHRAVSKKQLYSAFTLGTLMLGLVMIGGVVLSASNGFSLTDSIYETTSALGTVGLSTGLTPSLNTASRILLIFYMFFGRVGIMTISLGFLFRRKSDELYSYAETNLLIG